MSKFNLCMKPTAFNDEGKVIRSIQFVHPKKAGFEALDFCRNQTKLPKLSPGVIYTPDETFYFLDIPIQEETARESKCFVSCWEFTVWVSEKILSDHMEFYVDVTQSDETGEVQRVKIKSRVDQEYLIESWVLAGFPEYWF